ncbi:MAG: flagellar type III secretion system pore protein FliP [Dethiobacter sp.]|jgi:flagellar biosynthetic protein FliP|nr:flagellar type III secretion system pore protein FliP [Dethiobacter sp.]MBS3902189.1 flagellar type III secretion system pore protein FliP [Dethiobacter sp.]MBS3988739.1 flagellar type III secretion system pore protein FliP [Dethiobacter sp.]
MIIRKKKIVILSLGMFLLLALLQASPVFAQPAIPIPNLNLELGTATEPEQVVGSLQLLLLLTVLTLVPAILALMTSFTRTVIVLSFVRSALGTQQIPPNQVLIGLALFLTFFIMAPVYQEVNTTAIQPYLAEEVEFNEALTAAMLPLREFMFRHTREKDLALFVNIANAEKPRSRADVALHVLIPAFVISELKTAFQMGFMIFIPFLVIDMVVASALMSMGMFMLPPVMVSLPFKLLLFVMVDGWHLVVQSLVESFA